MRIKTDMWKDVGTASDRIYNILITDNVFLAILSIASIYYKMYFFLIPLGVLIFIRSLQWLSVKKAIWEFYHEDQEN